MKIILSETTLVEMIFVGWPVYSWLNHAAQKVNLELTSAGRHFHILPPSLF